MEVKCNICGKTINYEESNDSFPINYFEKELVGYGCCRSCNKYVVMCRRIKMTFPKTAELLFSNRLGIAELEQICDSFDFINKKLAEPYSAKQHIRVSHVKTHSKVINENSFGNVPFEVCYEEINSGSYKEIEIVDEDADNKIILCYKASSMGVECVAILNDFGDKKYLMRHFHISVGENYSLCEQIDGRIEHWNFKVCLHPEDIRSFEIRKFELHDVNKWELLCNEDEIQYFENAYKQEVGKDLDKNKLKHLFSEAINKSNINYSATVSLFDTYTFSFSLVNGERFSKSFSDISLYDELIALIKNSPQKIRSKYNKK